MKLFIISFVFHQMEPPPLDHALDIPYVKLALLPASVNNPYNLEPPPGPEDSRAVPLGGMDHGTVMARVSLREDHKVAPPTVQFGADRRGELIC